MKNPLAVFSSLIRLKKNRKKAKLFAVGTGRISEDGAVHPLDVSAGDMILFGKWSGTEVKIDGEELLIMKESDVLGIIKTKGKKT